MTETLLAPLRRGDTFRRSFTIGNGWTSSQFETLKFSVRETPAIEGVDDDDDLIGQATVAGGGIVFSTGTAGVVTIAASVTTTWPTGRVYWDLQATVAGPPQRVYTVDSGFFQVKRDVTRET